jgi:hypothetical protein
LFPEAGRLLDDFDVRVAGHPRCLLDAGEVIDVETSFMDDPAADARRLRAGVGPGQDPDQGSSVSRAQLLAGEREKKAMTAAPPERSTVERALYKYDNGFGPRSSSRPPGRCRRISVRDCVDQNASLEQSALGEARRGYCPRAGRRARHRRR